MLTKNIRAIWHKLTETTDAPIELRQKNRSQFVFTTLLVALVLSIVVIGFRAAFGFSSPIDFLISVVPSILILILVYHSRVQSTRLLADQKRLLTERVKELNCLYSHATLMERQDITFEALYQGTVELLPPAWQYPEITCARLSMKDRTYITANFEETVWRQASPIRTGNEQKGVLEVFYLEERPQSFEGPFLREERLLIDELTRRLGQKIEALQAEQGLLESQERFRATFEQAAVGIAHVSPDGHFLLINQRFCDLVGYSRDELLSMSFQEITHPDDIGTDLEQVHQLLRREIYTYTLEKRYVRKDGGIQWVQLTVSIMWNDENVPKYMIGVVVDINHRKQAEQALKYRDAILSAVSQACKQLLVAPEWEKQIDEMLRIMGEAAEVDRASLFLFHKDQDGILRGNLAYEWDGLGTNRVLGNSLFVDIDVYKAGFGSLIETLQQKKPGYLHPEELPDSAQRYTKAAQTATSVHIPIIWDGILLGSIAITVTRPERTLSHLEIDAFQIEADMLGAIMARKRSETKLRETVARLRLATQLGGLGIWDWNIKTDHTEWYGEMFRIYGITPEEFTGQGADYIAFTREDYRELQARNFERSFKTAITPEQLALNLLPPLAPKELVIVRPDGSEAHTIGDALTILDDSGQPTSMIGITVDITQRKLTEAALRESEHRFRLIVENMPILLDAFDEDGNIIVWNKACEQVTGYTADEIINNPRAMEMLYPDPDYRAYMWQAALNPDSTDSTFDITCKNGEIRTVTWFETYRTLLVPGWATWGMGQDVTERKRAETIIVQSAAELSRSNALINSLAEVASQLVNTHDVNAICEIVGTELKNLNMRTVINLLDEDRQQLTTGYLSIDPAVQAEFQRVAGITSNQYFIPLPAFDGTSIRGVMDERRKQIDPDPCGYICTNLLGHIPCEQAESLLEQAGIHSTTKVFWYCLIVKDQVVGTMTVWGENLRESDWLALSVFAGQVASVILNAKLYHAEREQRVLAEGLRDSAIALNSTLSLEEVLARILDSLEQVLPHDAANVMLVESGIARIVGKRGYDQRGLNASHSEARWVVDHIPGLKQMSETGQPLAIPDTHQFPQWVPRPESAWIRSIVGAPIQHGNEVIGFLNLDSASPNFFSNSDAAALQAFAAQAGVGIQNARLYEAERRERALAQTFRRATQAMSNLGDARAALNLVSDLLAEILPYDRLMILLEEGDLLRPVVAVGFPDNEDELLDLYSYSDVPPLYQSMSEAAPLFLDENSEHRKDYLHLPVYTESVTGWIGVPLVTSGVVIGFLAVATEQATSYDSRDVETAQAFAHEVVLAISQSRLLDELHTTQGHLTRVARLSVAGEIAAGVAHQINNPLTSVIGHTHLLMSEHLPESSVYQRAEKIKQGAYRAATVVQRMLDFARVRPFELEEININDSLQTAIGLIRSHVEPRLARLILQFIPDLPPIMGSQVYLEDVWINLILNAADVFKEQDGGQITISTSLAASGDSVIVTINDNGPGIPRDALAQVFDPFFTTKAHGTGLGLAICHDVVTQHRGTIRVDSDEGKGATFTINLPIAASKNEAVDQTTKE